MFSKTPDILYLFAYIRIVDKSNIDEIRGLNLKDTLAPTINFALHIGPDTQAGGGVGSNAFLAIRRFMTELFGCYDFCVDFQAMAAGEIEGVGSLALATAAVNKGELSAAPLWLWRAHSTVNRRLGKPD